MNVFDHDLAIDDDPRIINTPTTTCPICGDPLDPSRQATVAGDAIGLGHHDVVVCIECAAALDE